MKGYKIVDTDYKAFYGSDSTKYEIGKTYTYNDVIKLGQNGYHFCISVLHCMQYKKLSPDIRVLEVEAMGLIMGNIRDRYVTEKIRIVREISLPEVKKLITGMFEFKNRTEYRENGLLHNNDLHAILYKNGDREWWYHGKLHRGNNYPALITFNRVEWWKDGKRHRDNDQPVIEFNNGIKLWFKDGVIHRDFDKPAIVCNNGTKAWYQDGIQIREEKKSDIETSEFPFEEIFGI